MGKRPRALAVDLEKKVKTALNRFFQPAFST